MLCDRECPRWLSAHVASLRAGLILSLLAPRLLAAQATVTSIVVDGARVDGTDRVEWFAYAAVEPAALKVGASVELDDELRSVGGGVEVELACAEGGAAVLHGSFRVLVVPPSDASEDAQCVLRVNAGAVDVSSTVPTALESGGVVAGTRSTQYGMVVGRAADGRPSITMVVFDGEVAVTRSDVEVLVTRGSAVDVVQVGGRGQMRPRAVQDSDVLRSARAFGRLGAGGVAPTERAAATRELSEAYARVLRDPSSADAKIELGAVGARYRTPSRLLSYQLREVPNIGATSSQAATALALESAVLTSLGDSAAARSTLQRALIQDSTVLTRVRGTLAVPDRSLPPGVLVPGAAAPRPGATPAPTGVALPVSGDAGARARTRVAQPDSAGAS